MRIEKINSMATANIYSIKDASGKVLGTKIVTLAGRFAGVTYQTWSDRTRAEIRRIFKETEGN